MESLRQWVQPQESKLMVLSANGYQDELNGEEFQGFVRTINMSVKSNLHQTGQRLGTMVKRGTQTLEASVSSDMCRSLNQHGSKLQQDLG